MPTANASSASSDRLSYGDGTTTTVAASSASRRSRSESRPAKRTQRSSGSCISFTPISTSDASPPSCDVGAEVLDQLLAALARVDAAAVEREVAMQPMPPPEHRAAPGDVLGVRLVVVFGVGDVELVDGRRRLVGLRGCPAGPCGRSTPQPTVSSAIARIEKCVSRNRRSTSVL